MSLKVVLAVAAVTLSLSAGQSFAESEGNGDPFAFRAWRGRGTSKPGLQALGAESVCSWAVGPAWHSSGRSG